MPIEKLDERIFKYLDKFNLRSDEINHLMGICRKPEGKEFLFGKIKDALYSLEMVRSIIRKQFGCELCGQKEETTKFKSKQDKARKVLEIMPSLSKQQVALIVGCSIKHVEMVIYGEI